LKEILESIRRHLDIKSSRTKIWYDLKARQIHFEMSQKVWFYNFRRMVEKAPKLQNSRKNSFLVVRKLSNVVYCYLKVEQTQK